MWMIYSIPLWISTFAMCWSALIAGVLIVVDCTVGIGLLVVVYNKIYAKYKV